MIGCYKKEKLYFVRIKSLPREVYGEEGYACYIYTFRQISEWAGRVWNEKYVANYVKSMMDLHYVYG